MRQVVILADRADCKTAVIFTSLSANFAFEGGYGCHVAEQR
jgi:hypothetical protein